jgi:hypothetical protein
MYNLVSSKTVSPSTTVRIRVKGLKAAMTYSGFAYQNATMYFNTSITQGDFVEYHWLFERTVKYITTSKTASYTFHSLGTYNVTLYAHNNASYEGFRVSTLVIPNPLSIQIPSFVKAGIPQRIGCQIAWPGGTPQSFFQQFNLSGKKGTDLPEKVDTILEFGDGNNISKNSSEDFVYYTFSRDTKKAQDVQCTVKNHIDLSVKGSTMAIDEVRELQIQTECSQMVSVGSRCKFEAKFSGDFANCHWVINENDGRLSSTFSNCTLEHKFENEYESVLIVNVSNPVSSMASNITLVILRQHVSAPATPVATGTVFVTAVTTETISPSSTYTATSSMHSNSSHTTNAITNTTLICPSYGFVGQRLSFEVSSTSGSSLTFSWNIDNNVLSTSKRVLYHVFESPGIYTVTSNATNNQDHVSRTCRVIVQYLIMGFKITKLELLKDMNIELGFEILQGTSVAYKVDFGDEGKYK